MTESKPDKPPPPQMVVNQAGEISAADYAAWRGHPTTRFFLQYLRDRRADVIEAATGDWLAGKLALPDNHDARAWANVLDQIVEHPFDDLAAFYAPINKEDDDEPAGA